MSFLSNYLTSLDLIIISCLIFAALAGLLFGFIKMAGAIISLIISLFAAGLFYKILALKLLPYVFNSENFANIISFILIYVVCSFILSLLVKLADKIFKLPILSGINRLGGLVIGLGEGILLISLLLYLIDKFSWLEQISQFIHTSKFSEVLIIIGKYLAIGIPGI